ncbi:DNA replication complex GINS family protein [Candidatus Woesearchaeota archaeon]|nr:DNA replication complex GINS family protein [Candidatus Woesearchaeota archaeon]
MTITYETLFEVLRKEKNQEDLQKLDLDFYKEVQKYVEEKTSKLDEKPRLDQFIEGYEQEMTALRIQLNNIRKIVRDIFDRRERKIIEMAVNKAKTGSNIVDTSALLPEEKEFFDNQIATINSFRRENLNSVLGFQTPNKPKDLNIAPSEQNIEFKKVQMLESVPKFVGVDLEIYGPFNASEEVELNPEIAEMLIKTSKAKIIE